MPSQAAGRQRHLGGPLSPRTYYLVPRPRRDLTACNLDASCGWSEPLIMPIAKAIARSIIASGFIGGDATAICAFIYISTYIPMDVTTAPITSGIATRPLVDSGGRILVASTPLGRYTSSSMGRSAPIRWTIGPARTALYLGVHP